MAVSDRTARPAVALGVVKSRGVPSQCGLTCYIAAMSISPTTTTVAAFNPVERDYLRQQLDVFFSTLPTVAEGIQLRTWKNGTRKGAPKVPPAAQSLMDRGLMRLDTTARFPRLFFTPEGLAALRRMMADARLANPQKFAHIRQELGIDPPGARADAAG
jgi:hypothetical protein